MNRRSRLRQTNTRAARIIDVVDRERALAELSIAHAVALRLREAGAGERVIAAALAVPVEGVRTLIEVAEAKLAALCREEP